MKIQFAAGRVAAGHKLARRFIAARRVTGKRNRLIQNHGNMPAGQVGLDNLAVDEPLVAYDTDLHTVCFRIQHLEIGYAHSEV